MKLDRYNQITIAIISTAALVALLTLAVSFGVNLFSERSIEGIVIDRVNRQKPTQALVVCVPEHVRGSDYEYFPIAAVVSRDANETPVVASMAIMEEYSSRAFGDSCRSGRYGSYGHIFNVIVKNTSTGEERLLLDKSAQVVSLARPSDKCGEGEGNVPCGTLLWTTRPADSNKDGVIDDRDANVEFVSDLTATSLTQVTPSDATSLAKVWFQKSSKLVFQIRRDANNDGRITDEDGSEVIEVDPARPAIGVPSLSEATTKKLSALLQ